MPASGQQQEQTLTVQELQEFQVRLSRLNDRRRSAERLAERAVERFEVGSGFINIQKEGGFAAR